MSILTCTQNCPAKKNFGRKILGRYFFGRKIFARIFSWGGLGGRSRSNHFKKFAKANFLKWCRGGVLGGEAPPGISVTRALPPGGGLGGFAPQQSPLITRALPPQRPCLAPVPCPHFFFARIFSSNFFRPNFFLQIFSSECFRPIFFVRRPSFRRPSSVRPSVRPSSVRPSVRPSVRSWCHL